MHVELLYFEGCPSWQVMDEHLSVLGAEFGFAHQRVLIDTPEAADRVGFLGSPTVRIDGEDPFAAPSAAVGLSCRIYQTAGGVGGCPTLGELRAALRSLAPADLDGSSPT